MSAAARMEPHAFVRYSAWRRAYGSVLTSRAAIFMYFTSATIRDASILIICFLAITFPTYLIVMQRDAAGDARAERNYGLQHNNSEPHGL